ncbi:PLASMODESMATA CALLOSE-BINDING PROTEIN 3-like [Humulus lupulus]|uniref:PLASMODESMATA CALLOSE-BINDING PROTEIN 3-like n=1 Tax=Humulus lupulus TaxID=3486 RepID=UPI002B4061F3|nr:PLASMODESMATA CALLOSE-BINDING PROTEIN 3-like [Humulus lupulus]
MAASPTLSQSQTSFSITLTTLFLSLLLHTTIVGAASTWCVARSDATIPALQTALDYACGAGADCIPLQSNGLCFLPNTIQAHASYAFNSFYQRKAMAPGSCDFSGTATVAQSDPSYGSCVYPSSLSTAGGTSTTTSSTNNPTTVTPTTTTPGFGNGGTGGLTPGMTPTIPDNVDNSRASSDLVIPTFFTMLMFLLVLTVTLKPIYVFSY